MSPQTLLAELEKLSYQSRVKRIIDLGRNPANAAFFDQLEAGATSYERRLALLSCATSRDGERVLRRLLDASRRLRGLARRLLTVVGTDEQVLRGAALLPPRKLRRLLVLLRARGRGKIIDAILARHLAEQEGAGLETLIGLASSSLAEQFLRQQFKRASTEDYGRLARLHPRLALERTLRLAQALEEPQGSVLGKANAVLAVESTCRTQSDRALALQLARELHRLFPLSRIQLEMLFSSGSAQAVAELVLASGERVKLPWSARLHQLPLTTCLALVESQGRAFLDWAKILRRLAPAARGALFEKFQASWQDRHGAISLEILRLMPRPLRESEGRRHLRIANLQATPTLWLPYGALLPAAEAQVLMAPFLGDPEPALRGAALAALVDGVRFERTRLGEVLERLEERAHEQDPVRMAMLGALAALPPSIFAEEHLPALARLQRQALDARDLSYGTSSQFEHILVALLPRFPEWAGRHLAELLQERGQLTTFHLEARVNDSQMRALGPRLEPLLRIWAQREHAPFLLVLRALGRRLKVWEAGAQLLVEFLRTGPDAQLSAAAEILSSQRPDLWQKVAPELLAQDESWVLVPAMFSFLTQQRQDLLSPAILGRRQLEGRFASGSSRQLLAFRSGFWKWTPAQQALFAQTLDEILHGASRESPGAIFVIDCLCQLPDVPPTLLVEQAQLRSPQAAWREAALRVLARLDGGEGIPTLLDALADERARIAIYGLRGALLEMPAAGALAILRTVSLQKVTVAKEVVRLLGDLASPEALDLLLELGQRDLHRDVQVAVLRGLWEHLEDARSWLILERAAASEDPAIATMVARTTHPRLSAVARARLNTLLARLLQHADVRVRLQVLQHGTMGTLSDPNRQLLEPLLQCLESPVVVEYTTAAQAIWLTYGGAAPETARQAISSAVERLQPRRQALAQVFGGYGWAYRLPAEQKREFGRTALQGLAADEGALPLRLSMALSTLTGEENRKMVEDLVSREQLHPEALMSLAGQLEGSDQFALRLGVAFAAWRSAPSPLLRRLALAILIGRANWTPERRAALEEFRRDPLPW